MTKRYLFAAVTSTLLLLLVVPILKDPLWIPTEIASIAALLVISTAVGGLTAETYVIVKRRTAMPSSSAKKYFMSLVCSLLFLAIVAPSIQSAVDSTGVMDAATVVVLLVLSLALGGLAAEGFFALFLVKTPTRQYVTGKNGPNSAVTGSEPSSEISSSNSLGSPSNAEESFDIAAHIDSRFKALDVTLERRIQVLKEQLLGAIQEVGREPSPNRETKANVDSASTSAPTKTTQVKPHQFQQETPMKDQVVDALLGKAKVGGK